MKDHLSVLSLTVTAAGPIAANRCVGFDDAQASVQGQKVKGVSQYAADAAGKAIAATAIGLVAVETGAAVAAGDALVSGADARAIAAPGVEGEYVFADALEAASAAGETIMALLRR